ncbi:uncharacterized protein LOC124798589 [Schistocerca piceifrons]|uniref:uncharacterized protein LOC124798589 n=1 Tax=Schistocerca piceifrons TaxID=274613 RepID=UPI001F5F9072|nr:uncharacterized protein LOC124798589 [Schistocerca piceifrons]
MVKGVSCRTVGCRLADAEVLTRIECELVVSRRLGTRDFEFLDVKLAKLGGDGLGFMSEQYVVDVRIRTADSKLCNLRFFAKTLPRQSRLREDFIAAYGCFNREVAFYSTVAPLLKTALQQNGGKQKYIPECYFTTKDTLVFEDLTEGDFRSLEPGQALDYDHCSLVLKNLAALHAASILHEENVIKSEGKIYRISDSCSVDLVDKTTATVEIDGKARNWFDSCVKTVEPLLELLPKYKGKCDAIRAELPCMRAVAERLLSPSDELRSVVCHGDLWTSNLLFRYQADSPTQVRFVDFQMARYLPPSTDVMVFLHLSTRRSFRQQWEPRLLGEYYEALERELWHGGVDAQRVLPRQQFLDSCEAARDLGRAVAAAYCPTVLMPAEHTDGMLRMRDDFERILLVDRGREVCECFLEYPEYRDRVTEVVQEFVDHCILSSNPSIQNE